MVHDSRSASRVGRFAPFFLLLLGTMWGFNTSVIKIAGAAGAPPIGITTLQMTGAAFVLSLFCYFQKMPIRFSWDHLTYYFHVGLLGTALPSLNMVFVLQELAAGVVVLAIATAPLFTYIGSLFVKLERYDLLRLCGVVVGLIGVLVIILPGASLPRPEDTGWFFLSLLTPALYSYSGIAAAKLRPEGAHSFALSGGMTVLISLIMWPIAAFFGQVYVPPISEPTIATAAILAIVSIACVAYFLYFELVRAIGPVSLSVVGYVVTLAGMMFGIVLLGESHSNWVWLAAAFIFCGLALVNGRQAVGAVMTQVRG